MELSSENSNLQGKRSSRSGTISSKTMSVQGRAGAVILNLQEPAQSVKGEIWGKPALFKNINESGKVWLAYLGPDRVQLPGEYLLKVKIKDPAGKTREFFKAIRLREKNYPEEKLTLQEEPYTPELLAQITKDNNALIAAMSAINPVCYWDPGFVRPVPGDVTSPFGTRRIINNSPRSPHFGTDFKAAEGDEVHAVNNGKVSIVYQGYLTGNSLIIDHGCGLYSVYFHLSEIMVKTGDMVKKGQTVAKAGMSGRASGPHLHFSLRLDNTYIDPVALFEISQQVDQELSGANPKISP